MPTVEISQDAETIVRGKAYELNVPESVILDAMIREFSPSSATALTIQTKTQRRAGEEFVADNPTATIEQAFRRGHHVGWTAYQLRKPDTFINLIRAYQRATGLETGPDAPR